MNTTENTPQTTTRFDVVADAERKNAALRELMAAAKAGRGYIAVHTGRGQAVHAARTTLAGHSGYNHPRPVCQPASSASYASPHNDPLTKAVTCKRCLAGLAKRGIEA